MEEIINNTLTQANQPLSPETAPVEQPKYFNQNNNIFKILFFIFIFILIAVVITAITLINKAKQEVVTSNNASIQTTTKTDLVAVEEDDKTSGDILKILDIQMELPKGWKVSSVSGNRAKILTDYKEHQVFLTLQLLTTYPLPADYWQHRTEVEHTKYGIISLIGCGGNLDCHEMVINDKAYSFGWGLESDQVIPEDLDGVWVPDHNIERPETFLSILRTIKPLD